MNLRRGIDTKPTDFFILAKINVPFDDRETIVAALKALHVVTQEKMHPDRGHGFHRNPDGTRTQPRLAAKDFGLNLLTAFGLRFFLGPLGDREVQNFPPGGLFEPRPVSRFGITERNAPLYLRTMNASGDRDWVAKRLIEAAGGTPPTEAEIDKAYFDWLSNAESDILLQMECDNLFLLVDLWDAVRKTFIDKFDLTLVSRQEGFNRGDGKDHTGFHDGISNLQDKMILDPMWYRSKVYLPHPAPAYPGEPDFRRDDPRYDGGTYLVHRKYIEHVDKFNAEDFEVRDHYGKMFKGATACLHAIGRDRETGKVISRAGHDLLEREPDSVEVNLGYNESHVLKARGGITAPFEAPFPPLIEKKDPPQPCNVFNTQDIRIRRRGVNFAEIDPKTGRVTYGLHFICFQNNIQQTGFEFINNIWLMNPLFRRSKDGLFNPDAGVITPVEGCYYFVPPESRAYSGDVFFE
jgi:deferrochelatase/peroxidase EfeB